MFSYRQVIWIVLTEQFLFGSVVAFDCSQSCFIGEEFCANDNSCLPEYLNCSAIEPADKQYPLLGHVDIDMLSSTVFPISSLTEGEAFVWAPSAAKGEWILTLSNGEITRDLSSQSPYTASGAAYLQFIPKDTDYYGAKVLIFGELSGNYYEGIAYEPQDGEKRTAILLVKPVARAENLHLKSQPEAITIENRNNTSVNLQVGPLLGFKITVQNREIPKSLYPYISREELDLFHQYKTTYLNMQPKATVLSMSTNDSWYIKDISRDTASETIKLSTGATFLVFTSNLTFIPPDGYYGKEVLELKLCYCDFPIQSQESVAFNISVELIEPIKAAEYIHFPPLPFNISDDSNSGFNISVLKKHVFGRETPSLGMLIYGDESELGTWHFKLRNDDIWQELELYKASGGPSIDTVRLGPNASLKFTLINDTFWSKEDAGKVGKLVFRFWEMSDNAMKGKYWLRISDLDSSEYSNEVIGTVLRNGCDNVPASMMRLDSCGDCNGTNACVACDGVAFSNASYDDCGECVGGNTGEKWNYLKDCNDTCGLAELDDCNVCQPKNDSLRIDYKDCFGDCHGEGKLNKCGICYGGTSGVDETEGMDVCGVCNGTNSTCKGCDGVPNSGKKYDFCDECLHPNDTLFNNTCIALLKFSPTTSPVAGGRVLLVESARIHNLTVARCVLVHQTGDILGAREVTVDPSNEGMFNITTPEAPVGTARLECSFGRSTKRVPVPHLQLIYYDPDALSITTVRPTELDLNSQHIELNGTEFNQTTQLYCAYMAEGHSMLIEARIQSAATAMCDLPRPPHSIMIRLTVVAAKEDGSLADLQKLPNAAWKNLTIYAPPPKVISANLSDDFKRITITFQNRTESRQTECSDIFEIDVEAAFGTGARCIIEEFTKLVIHFGDGVIKLPTNLTIKENVTYAYDELYARSSRIVVSVMRPTIIPAPVATLTGPSKVGRCDSFVLKAKISGFTGDRPVNYDWDINFADTVDAAVLTNDDKHDLERLKSFFNRTHTAPNRIEITSDMLKQSTSTKHFEYSISLKVSNFLSASSTTSIVVQRVDTNPPIVQILGDATRYVKATEKLLIIAKVQTSSCQTSTEALQYQWTIFPDVEFNTKSQNTPRLLIPPRTFRPGSTYKISLTVRYPSNPTVSSTTAISVTANISQLVAKIKGGQYRAIGSAEDFVLDASKSYDPDRVVGDTEVFGWYCTDSNSRPCVRADSTDPNQPTDLTLPQTNSIAISSGTLVPNEEYTFEFKYTKGSRSASQKVYITIVPGRPPNVNMRPLKKEKVNFNDKIVLKGHLTTRTSANTDVWWESVQYEGGRQVLLSDSQVTNSDIRHQISREGVSSFVLILNSGALPEGAEYKFRLNAQNENGLGFASITLTVNGPPTAGMLTSSILEGVALESLFNLQAASGWSDAAEDMPLTYRFGFKGAKSKDYFLGGASLENEASVMLPVGTDTGNRLGIFVDVSDKYGATSRAGISVTVNPMSSISASTIDNLSDNLKGAFQSKDVSAAVGQLTSTLAVLNGIDETDTSPVSEEAKAKIIAFKEETSSACLSMLGSASDAESQNMVIDLMPDITKGGENFNPQLKKDISQSIASAVKSQVPTQGSQASPPITFTFAGTDDIEQDIGKSPDEIARIVQTFQNILNTSLYDNTSMQVKREFTGLVDTLLTALCAKSTFGESPLVAFTGLSVLQSFKYNLFDNGTTNLSIASDGWESSGYISGLINVGKELASKYGEWQCTDDYVCNGLCLGSVQLPQDLYSDEAMRENNTMISPAMKLNLYNPETNAMLTEEQLTAPITFLVPLDDTKYNSNNSVECKYWDEASSSWKNDSCEAEEELKVMGTTTYAVCKCFRTGAVAAFEVEKVVSGAGTGSGGTGGTNWGGNAGNATRSNPLLTLFIFIGMLGFSLSLGFGFCGFERFKAMHRITPNE